MALRDENKTALIYLLLIFVVAIFSFQYFYGLTGKAAGIVTLNVTEQPAPAAETIPPPKSVMGAGGQGKTGDVHGIIIVGDTMAGEAKTITNIDQRLFVDKIILETSKLARDVAIFIDASSKPPAEVSSTPKEIVFKYLEIKVPAIKDIEIKNAEIVFRVEKSWLVNNDLDKNTVALQRFKSASWQKLETTFSKEDGENIYYAARTQGFSVFAITAQKLVRTPEKAEIKADVKVVPAKLPTAEIIAVIMPLLLLIYVFNVLRKNRR